MNLPFTPVMLVSLAMAVAAGCGRAEAGGYRSEEDAFRSWTPFLQEGTPETRLRTVPRSPSEAATTELLSLQGRGVGLNREVPVLRGEVSFEYRVTSSASGEPNVFVVVIPIKSRVSDQGGQRLVVEVGAEHAGDPANATSTWRARFAVPEPHQGDGQWHTGRLAFDFTRIPEANFAIVGLRLNEGAAEPAPAHAYFRDIRVAKLP
jgi:hypothetical protein